jgi:hypothetical protein
MKIAVAILTLCLATAALAVVPFPMAMWMGPVTSSDVTPMSIPGLVAWWRSDSLVGYTNGQSVTDPWEDLTGNGWDALATNASYNPVYYTNTFGDYPGLDFDAWAETRLDITGGVGYAGSLSLSNGWTIMALWSPTRWQDVGGYDDGGGVVIGDDYTYPGCSAWGIYRIADPPSEASLYLESDPGTGPSVSDNGFDFAAWGTAIVGTWQRGDDSNVVFHVGMTNFTGVPATAVGTMHLNTIGGCNNSPALRRLGAMLGELCVWDAALTTNQIAWLYTNYWAPRYGL